MNNERELHVNLKRLAFFKDELKVSDLAVFWKKDYTSCLRTVRGFWKLGLVTARLEYAEYRLHGRSPYLFFITQKGRQLLEMFSELMKQ